MSNEKVKTKLPKAAEKAENTEEPKKKKRKTRPNPDTEDQVKVTLSNFGGVYRTVVNIRNSAKRGKLSMKDLRRIIKLEILIDSAKGVIAQRRKTVYSRAMLSMFDDFQKEIMEIKQKILDERIDMEDTVSNETKTPA